MFWINVKIINKFTLVVIKRMTGSLKEVIIYDIKIPRDGNEIIVGNLGIINIFEVV